MFRACSNQCPIRIDGSLGELALPTLICQNSMVGRGDPPSREQGQENVPRLFRSRPNQAPGVAELRPPRVGHASNAPNPMREHGRAVDAKRAVVSRPWNRFCTAVPNLGKPTSKRVIDWDRFPALPQTYLGPGRVGIRPECGGGRQGQWQKDGTTKIGTGGANIIFRQR